jgi:histidyl-tRNA synthetase
LLEEIGLAPHTAALLRALDKLPKIGRDAVTNEMAEKTGVASVQAGRLLDLAETRGTNAEILDRLKRDFGGNAKAADGIRRLDELVRVAKDAGIADGMIAIDLSIARGLDYYTGTVYETFLSDLPAIGSVCSGGRYDNLAGLYTKQALPGVGASLGLDRLIAAMEELKLLGTAATPASLLLVQFQEADLGAYQAMARSLRAAGIGVEVFPEAKKIGPQLQYAEKRGFRLALIAGPDELSKGVWKIKDLAKREERTVAAVEVAVAIKSMLT